MNRIPVFLSLILLVGSTVTAQDGAAAKRTADEEFQHQGGTAHAADDTSAGSQQGGDETDKFQEGDCRTSEAVWCWKNND